jgi:glycosyltransferase involved in cell wall biosynthesis
MHCHSDPFDWHGQGVLFKIAIQGYALIHKLKLSLADWILVVSEEYKQYARFFKPHYDKLSVHLMSVSPVFKPLESVAKKTNQVLYIGRIDKRKGIDSLIQAMDGLENSSLLIVGDGDKELTQRLKEMSTNLIKDNPSVDIQFVGKKTQHELNHLLNEATVLVLPTIDKTAETFGAVLIEAWATKTPVISANNPAPMGLIEQSSGGLIFERGDSEDLKVQLQKILKNPAYASELGVSGYEFVREGLTYQSNARKLNDLYNQLIG